MDIGSGSATFQPWTNVTLNIQMIYRSCVSAASRLTTTTVPLLVA